MLCRLCLVNTNKSHSIEETVQKCITKFLQLELLPEDPVSTSICNECWSQLDNFQKFCVRIDEAQQTLLNTRSLVVGSDELGKTTDALKDKLEDSEVKQEDRNSDLSGCLSDNDVKSCCSDLNDDLVKVEYDENNGNAEINHPIEDSLQSTTEPIHKLRSARRSTNTKTDLSNLPKAKRKKSQIVDTDKTETSDESEGEEAPKRRRRAKNKKPKTFDPDREEKLLKIKEVFKGHDEIIAKYKKLSCDICSVALTDFGQLKIHFRRIHNVTGYVLCCNKRLLTRKQLVDHIHFHNNPEHFKCTDCGKTFAGNICLQNHMLNTHQTDDLKPYTCEVCSKKFAQKHKLTQHMDKHVPKKQKNFFCNECGKGYSTALKLKYHIKFIHSNLPHRICEICAQVIRGDSALKRHVERHNATAEPQVQCTECGAWLKNKSNLIRHMDTQHSKVKKVFTCEVCGKDTPSKGALWSHMKYRHRSVTFQCTLCEKSFKREEILKEHIATHTGEALYTCPYCPAEFKSNANMYTHKKRKHLKEWEASKSMPKGTQIPLKSS